MARTTKQLSGGGKDKFLRGLIASEPTLPAETARHLADTLCDAIADVRVRREAWERAPKVASTPSTTEPPPAHQGDARPDTPSAVAVFDPFVFSAMSVLTKHGAAALLEKLEAIPSNEYLHALARAQHLTIPATLTDPTALRAAILAATQTRLAERRAAAS